jgi:hypothetical protein
MGASFVSIRFFGALAPSVTVALHVAEKAEQETVTRCAATFDAARPMRMDEPFT